MTIFKKVGITLATLAIVGGGSLAVITASANGGRMFDTNAVQFITNGDLAGYKNYLIGQETTRINAIDQTQFDKIKVGYAVQKPLLELQAKYEPQLITLATNNDQAGFVTLFKQYQTEAKPVLDAIRAPSQAQQATQNSNATDPINKRGINSNRPAPTDAQLTEMANREYTKAVENISAGRTYKIGFGGRGRKHGTMGMRDGNFGSKIISSITYFSLQQ